MNELKEQILILRKKNNKSYNEIAKTIGCSKSLVGYYCNETTYNKQNKSSSLWRNTLKGRIKSKLSAFCTRVSHGGRKISNRTWRKRLRRYIEHLQNRGVMSLDKIKIADIINKFGVKTKCYLTGTPIDLEKDDYCFDHIVPVSKGGTNDLINLGITIPKANYSKSDLTVEEYLDLCKQVLEYNGYKVEKVNIKALGN